MTKTWITLDEKLYLRNFENRANTLQMQRSKFEQKLLIGKITASVRICPSCKSQLKLIQRSYLLLLNIKFAHHGKYGNCTTLKPEQICCKFAHGQHNRKWTIYTSCKPRTKAYPMTLFATVEHLRLRGWVGGDVRWKEGGAGWFRVRYACFILECTRLSPKPSWCHRSASPLFRVFNQRWCCLPWQTDKLWITAAAFQALKKWQSLFRLSS